MSDILKRLNKIESDIKAEPFVQVTYNDGGVDIKTTPEVFEIIRTKSRKIEDVCFIGDGEQGVLPDLIRYLINEDEEVDT